MDHHLPPTSEKKKERKFSSIYAIFCVFLFELNQLICANPLEVGCMIICWWRFFVDVWWIEKHVIWTNQFFKYHRSITQSKYKVGNWFIFKAQMGWDMSIKFPETIFLSSQNLVIGVIPYVVSTFWIQWISCYLRHDNSKRAKSLASEIQLCQFH